MNGVLAEATALLVRAGEQLRATSLEIIGGDGGILVLALGLLGLGVLAFDVLRLFQRSFLRAARRNARGATRAARARTLAAGGVAPPEIARQTGLPRDAVGMLAAATAGAVRRRDSSERVDRDSAAEMESTAVRAGGYVPAPQLRRSAPRPRLRGAA